MKRHLHYNMRSASRGAYGLFCAIAALVIITAAPACAEEFPVPDIIKPNVAFWIRIYTEVGLKEGLIHDTEYPQIIYEKVISGDLTGKARSNHIDSRRKVYINAVKAVRELPPDRWGANEKRVAELFKKAPEGAIVDAENRIRHQTGQRERFRQGLERSGAYIDTIAAILKAHGVPDELKYLPHVESSFDAEAYSKVGAAGLWQFMRSTGRGYMKIDYMFDERRDPIISTYAAAKFLRANYDMLGKWPLAVTAYNHGPNGMRRAVASVGSNDIADILVKHESPTFKFASRNFYSCFVAVLQIMEKPEKYFSNIKYAPRFQATSIKLPFSIRASAICKSLGISEQQFQKLNPSLRPVAFTHKNPIPSGYAINLPASMSASEALAMLNKTPAPQRPTQREITEELGEGGYYTVVRGDNLNNIARRLGVSMSELAEVNNITNASRIYIGQVLTIPTGATAKPAPEPEVEVAVAPVDTVTQVASVDTVRIDTTAAKVDTMQVAMADVKKVDTAKVARKDDAKKSDTSKVVKKDDVKKADTSKVVKKDDVKKSDTSKVVKKDDKKKSDKTKDAKKDDVKKSDTAKVAKKDDAKKIDTTKVAKKDDVKKSDTAKVTAIIDTTIKADVSAASAAADVPATLAEVAFKEADAIIEPSAEDSSDVDTNAIDTRFDATVYDLRITKSADGRSVRARVLVDETVLRFAEWARVYVADIRKLNGLSPDAGLQIGKTILIPYRSPEQIKRFETNRLQYHMAIEEDFFANYTVTDFDRRRVRSGDNPWRICRDAQIPMWLLLKYNKGINIFGLQIGQTLLIPRVEAKDALHEAPDFDPIITESEIAE